MIRLRVDHAALRLIRKEVVTSGAVNVFYVEFEFDDGWNGLTRIAQFRSGETIKSWVLPEDNICIIPWEVLMTAGVNLEIGVMGMDGEDIVLPTVWINVGIIQEGASGGDTPLPSPTPSLYEQLLRAIGNLEELKTEDKSSVVAAINEIYTNGGGEQSTIDHSELINRELNDQHPINAIQGLSDALQNKLDKNNLGDNLEITDEGKLQVKMAAKMEKDNTLPISSAEVFTQVGNINALLHTI